LLYYTHNLFVEKVTDISKVIIRALSILCFMIMCVFDFYVVNKFQSIFKASQYFSLF
jgi:hypothetical protein